MITCIGASARLCIACVKPAGALLSVNAVGEALSGRVEADAVLEEVCTEGGVVTGEANIRCTICFAVGLALGSGCMQSCLSCSMSWGHSWGTLHTTVGDLLHLCSVIGRLLHSRQRCNFASWFVKYHRAALMAASGA